MYSSYLLICLTKLFVLYCGTIIVTELSECAFRIFLKKYKKQWKQRRLNRERVSVPLWQPKQWQNNRVLKEKTAQDCKDSAPI